MVIEIHILRGALIWNPLFPIRAVFWLVDLDMLQIACDSGIFVRSICVSYASIMVQVRIETKLHDEVRTICPINSFIQQCFVSIFLDLLKRPPIAPYPKIVHMSAKIIAKLPATIKFLSQTSGQAWITVWVDNVIDLPIYHAIF